MQSTSKRWFKAYFRFVWRVERKQRKVHQIIMNNINTSFLSAKKSTKMIKKLICDGCQNEPKFVFLQAGRDVWVSCQRTLEKRLNWQKGMKSEKISWIVHKGGGIFLPLHPVNWLSPGLFGLKPLHSLTAVNTNEHHIFSVVYLESNAPQPDDISILICLCMGFFFFFGTDSKSNHLPPFRQPFLRPSISYMAAKKGGVFVCTETDLMIRSRASSSALRHLCCHVIRSRPPEQLYLCVPSALFSCFVVTGVSGFVRNPPAPLSYLCLAVDGCHRRRLRLALRKCL